MKTIGENIAALRDANGLTQQQLSDAAACHKNTVHNLETGKAETVQMDTLERIATALGVDVVRLVTPAPKHDPAEVAASIEVYLKSDLAEDDDLEEHEITALRQGPWPWGPLKPIGWHNALLSMRAGLKAKKP